MDIKKLQSLVVDALEDVKAQDIKVFDTTHLTSLFDRIAVASGTSNRQTKALASSVRDKVKEAGGHILSIEGEGTGEWVLVDLGDMIVHIMQPAIRAYYRLEEIWGEKEVKVGAARRVSTASKNADTLTPQKISRHLTSSQASAAREADQPKSIAAKKPATKTAPKTAAKTATRSAAKTTRTSTAKPGTKTTAKPAVQKIVVAGKTAAKKVARKSAAVKPGAVKKPRVSAAKTSTSPARKVAAKRAGKPGTR